MRNYLHVVIIQFEIWRIVLSTLSLIIDLPLKYAISVRQTEDCHTDTDISLIEVPLTAVVYSKNL